MSCTSVRRGSRNHPNYASRVCGCYPPGQRNSGGPATSRLTWPGSSSPSSARAKPGPRGSGTRRTWCLPMKRRRCWSRYEDCRSRNSSFRAFVGSGCVVSYGWRYDFNGGGRSEDGRYTLISAADSRQACAPGRQPAAQLQQVLADRIPAGSQIGWHKDKAVFGEVVGISFLSCCTFRFRRRAGPELGEGVFHCRTALRIPVAGSRSNRVGAQHSRGGYPALFHYLPKLPRTSIAPAAA